MQLNLRFLVGYVALFTIIVLIFRLFIPFYWEVEQKLL